MTNSTAMYHRTPKKAKIPERKVEKAETRPRSPEREREKQTEIETAASFCLPLLHSVVHRLVLVFDTVSTVTSNMATGPTANRPLTKTFCEACGVVFTPQDAMQIYQGKYYHPRCFCCAQCGNTLAGKPFYPKPNNQFQCEDCNHSLAPACVIVSFRSYPRTGNAFLVVVCVSRRFNQARQRRDFKTVIITVLAFGKDHFFLLSSLDRSVPVLHLAAANAMVWSLMVNRETLSFAGSCTSRWSLGHNFVDMLDGRFQCLTCSKHVVGTYKGKEHAPHIENTFGEIMPVQCDQAGRIPICDKCSRPVTSEEDAFKHDTRFYHLECAHCNRCRKKLFKVPCRKLGSALGKSAPRFEQRSLRMLFSFSLSRMLIIRLTPRLTRKLSSDWSLIFTDISPKLS